MTTADQRTSGTADAGSGDAAEDAARDGGATAVDGAETEDAGPPKDGERPEGVREAGSAGAPAKPATAEDAEGTEDVGEDAPDGLTPRQARRLRVAVATVVLVSLAVVLALRLASRTSVLVVGVYGLAMILCGVVIELSRHGRTRLGTWLLGTGLLAALAADWLLLP
ncbi:hypothetical protein [Streptomyces fradiae]|uniref:hypothetical protein n=1 Tax=Streptomyces fradiae TaxID=1906 RepID=UPI002943279D|nr:hypothetical protein [Streptomyces fradiae]WOI59697.1 hypothetical protein RYQ63_07135 [Streptomyces fradiae]